MDQLRPGEQINCTLDPVNSAPLWTAQSRRLFLYGSSLLLDTAAVAGSFFATDVVMQDYWLPVPGFAVLGSILSLFVMFSISKESQSIETLKNPYLGLQRSTGALVAAFLVEVILIFITQLGGAISRLGFAMFFVLSILFVSVSRLVTQIATKALLGSGVEATVLLLDGPAIAGERGMKVIDVGKMNLWPDLAEPTTIARLANMIAGYDRIIVACNEDRRVAWSIFLQGTGAGGEIVAGLEQSLGAVGIGRCSLRDTLILSRGPLSFSNRIMKRSFDLCVGIPVTIFLAPLLIAVAIAVKLDSPGPVFFRQERIGEGNRNFRIFKFRSMCEEVSDAAGSRSTSRDDHRISRVGRIIRRTSIDELPQLFNVLLGNMSLVGPRPHALGSLAGSRLFWDVDPRYWLRHSLRPGITGLAQVRGFRGATDNATDLEDRLRCDLEYLGSWSMRLDIQILLATFRVLVHDKAY
ncbi:sugar transferase [Sphingomonas sp. M1-B02]|uniref:sugar transferase n=1 Tax=Sphingomonas sp. M1-B02 TaxID=3114300 RepID=UPI00223E91D2|nr:sugar transferase [Sphingomonas sp. S6-11]UZK67741.1 sugar transferase [Sphingomonas sp. S6-11]